MKIYFSFLLSILFLTASAGAWAEGVKFISTDEAREKGVLQEGPPSVDDPYMEKAPTQRDYDGAPATQKSYGSECQDDLCRRAEQRQLGEGDWRTDQEKGLKPTGY